jgi:ABC-type antimicrobial peptide transport system permease subunit
VYTHPDSAPGPTVYLPYAQAPHPRVIIFLRAAVDPRSLVTSLRRAVHDVAPSFPLYDVRTMDERTATATARPRFTAGLLGLFSLIALVLAAVGIYGVTTVLVGQRRREIGIRVAVGADARAVVAMAMASGLRAVAVGMVLGLGGALALTRLLRGLLFDVATTDPLTYVVIVVVLGLSAALASWLPARRAAAVEPLQALRAE